MGKVLSINVVISLDENLSKAALSNRIVLCIELVKSVESVPVL